MKIALGTVQFGLDYGVSNSAGRVAQDEAVRILDRASAAGIGVIDTAWAYGGSEEVLGLLGAAERFRIITKTAPLDDLGVEGVSARFAESSQRLGADPLYGLLVHHAGDLLGREGAALAAEVRRLKASGAVDRIGVSAYNAEELFASLEVLGGADLVQVPVNVFDQRLIRNGALTELRNRGVEVHARSAFLQGLLLIHPEETPSYFGPIGEHLLGWHEFCAAHDMSPLSAALSFVTELETVDQVVVGVESAEQLAQIVGVSAQLPVGGFEEFALEDEAFIEPSRWRVER